MLKKEAFIVLCVFGIFLNLALLGFSSQVGTTQTQILAVLNILLLSFVFIKK